PSARYTVREDRTELPRPSTPCLPHDPAFTELGTPPSVPGATGKVYVVPAGAMGWSYVEKVARLDFSSHTESNESTGGAVHDGLRALLKGIRGSKNPDWVLLDARTGIHDLGGL